MANEILKYGQLSIHFEFHFEHLLYKRYILAFPQQDAYTNLI